MYLVALGFHGMSWYTELWPVAALQSKCRSHGLNVYADPAHERREGGPSAGLGALQPSVQLVGRPPTHDVLEGEVHVPAQHERRADRMVD